MPAPTHAMADFIPMYTAVAILIPMTKRSLTTVVVRPLITTLTPFRPRRWEYIYSAWKEELVRRGNEALRTSDP